MALANYSDLQAAPANWLARTDLNASGANYARVAEAITLAEARLNADLRLDTMALVQSTTMTAGNTATVFDVTTRVIRSIKITAFSPPHALSYASPEFFPNVQRAGSGEPVYYTLRTGLEWDIAPDSAYAIAIEYYPRLDLATSTTNWLMTNLPNVYLYLVCAILAGGLLADEAAAQRFGGLYADELPRAKRLLALVGGRGEAKAFFDVPVSEGAFNIYNGDE